MRLEKIQALPLALPRPLRGLAVLNGAAHLLGREAARGALLLLDVEGALVAALAQAVRLAVASV